MAGPTFDPNAEYDVEELDPIALVTAAAQKYGVDPALARSVLKAESGGDVTAHSSAGAYGPMQLTRDTAKGLGVNRYDPEQNIDGGVRYLKQMKDEFGADDLALAAYNAGPGAVRDHGGVPPYKETQEYVRKVLDGAKEAPPADVAPSFDPSQPFQVSDAPATAPGPTFDPAQPFTVDGKAPGAPSHPVLDRLKAAAAKAAQVAGNVATEANPLSTFKEAMGNAFNGGLNEIREGSRQFAPGDGESADPVNAALGLTRMVMGAGGVVAAPVTGAFTALAGRPIETGMQNAPHGEIKTPLGNVPYDMRISKEGVGDALTNIAGMFIPGHAGGERPVIRPIVDAETGAAGTHAQQATFADMQAKGELDPAAQPGSEAFPRLQRNPEDLPAPGEWYVDVDGRKKQAPAREEAPPSAVAPEQQPQEPTTVSEVVVEGKRPESPEAQPEAAPVDETPPAFDPARPFQVDEPSADFPGDRPEVQAKSAEPAPEAPPAQPDLTDQALDLIRNGKAVRQDRGPSLVDALIKEGGVKDEGGELSAFDPRAYGQRGGRLVRKGSGMSLDDAAQWAQERGYIGKPDLVERASPQDLLDALRRDLDGQKVYSREDPFAAELKQHADDLEEMLGELGINPHEASNAEIKKALNDYFTSPEAQRVMAMRTPQSPEALVAQARDRMQRQAPGEGPLFDQGKLGVRLPETDAAAPVAERLSRLQDRLALRSQPDPLAAAPTGPSLPGALRPGPVPRAEAATPQPLPQGASRVVDMAERLTRALDVTHRQGRMSLKGGDVLGEYSPESGVARTRNWSELDATSHEAFHHLDFQKLPNLRRAIDAHAAELIPLDYAFKPGEPPRPEAKQEGFAEFGRLYTTNPELARQRAPDFYQAFETALGKDRPKALKAVQGVQRDYQGYLKAPSADRVSAAVVTQHQPGMAAFLKKVGKDGVVNTASRIADDAYTAVIDRLHPLNRAVRELQDVYLKNMGKALDLKVAEDPYKLARLLPDAYGPGMMDLLHGVRPYDAVSPEGPSLFEALNKALGKSPLGWKTKGIEEFGSYLVARRMVNEWDRFAAGKLDREPHRLVKEDWQQAISDFEKAHPSWREAGDMVNGWTKQLWKKRYEAGFITKEAYEEGLAEQPFYVPLNRDISDKAWGNSRSGAPKDGMNEGGTYRFRGSTRDFINPIQSLMRESFELNAMVMANDVRKALQDLGKAAGNGAGKYVETIPATEMKAFTAKSSEVMSALETAQELSARDVESALAAQDFDIDLSKTVTLFRREATKARGEPVLAVWRDGKMDAIRLADGELGKGMYEALTNMTPQMQNVYVNAFAAGARGLRYGVTTHPTFVLSNLIRDNIATWINSDVGYKPVITSGRGLIDELTQAGITREYNSFGGVSGGGNVAGLDKARIARDIQELNRNGHPVKRFASWHGFQQLAEVSETGTRVGVYRLARDRALKQGMTPKQAALEGAFAARDILDFGRRGAKMNSLTRTIAFLNASLQGLDKAGRVLVGEPGAAIRQMMRGAPLTKAQKGALVHSAKAWSKMAALGVAGLAMESLYHDDKEFQGINSYIRATHWVLRGSDLPGAEQLGIAGKWLVVPKPFELGALSNVFERSYEAYVDKDPTAWGKLAEGLGQILVPPHDVQALSLPWAIATNRDSVGRPIVPDHLFRQVDPEMEVNSYTSEASRRLAKATGDLTEGLTGKRTTFSPAQADYAIAGVTGTWGRSALSESNRLLGKDAVAQGLDDGFLTGRFVKDAARGSQNQTDFWGDMSKDGGRLAQAAGSFDQLKEDPKASAEYLKKLDPVTRDYVLTHAFASELFPRVPGGATKLNPMVRAQNVISVISQVRQEVRSGPVARADASGKIELSADQRKAADDLLNKLGDAEMRDALIMVGERGYSQKSPGDTDEIRQQLAAVSPDLVQLLDAEMKVKKLPTQEQVATYWPHMQTALRSMGDELIQRAMLMRNTRTTSGKYETLRRAAVATP